MPLDIWLIFFVLGVILPWRGRMRMKKLLAMPHVSTTERLVLYASTIAFQWVAVSVVALRGGGPRFTAPPPCFSNLFPSPIFFSPGPRAPLNAGPSLRDP